jgi:hypothetical protein
MNEAKHTPGPWVAVECCETCILPCGVAVAVQMEKEPWASVGRICSMTGQGNGVYDPEVTTANARLIAAAPELLRYAQMEAEYTHAVNRRRQDWSGGDLLGFRAKHWVPEGEPVGAWLGRIRDAAIAKAKGGAQ